MTAGTHISLMLAVPSAAEAADYKRALGARGLWDLGGVVGMEIDGTPFFLHEQTNIGFVSPAALSATTVRVEVFCDDDPDALIARAVAAGADGSSDETTEHVAPWGVHRQADSPTPSVTYSWSETNRR